ncbi:MAG TPA: four helix bundle protein [Thermoanaerobaculia bacterium]|nr:four helix bundle protein [Thermoanaerobaculia bacterium]
MKKKIDIYDRAFQFACHVLKMDQKLSRNRRVNRNAMNQLVSAASSVGSNLEEARAGQSKADFHAKLRIALKEARESQYWLRLIAATEVIAPSRINPLIQESGEIVGILTTIARKPNPRNPDLS